MARGAIQKAPAAKDSEVMIPDATLAEWEQLAKDNWMGLVSEHVLALIAEIRRLREAPLDFTGHDHPEANGQRPTPGTFEWTFSFTLEDGRTLKVHVGERGFRAFEEMFLKNRAADYQERDQLKADLTACALSMIALTPSSSRRGKGHEARDSSNREDCG